MIRHTLQHLGACAGLFLVSSLCQAQWNPAAGQWGRTQTSDLRVMTWNVRDAICSTSAKAEGANNWCAVARIIASMKPDVVILQECGDNSGNGTGGAGDSQANLATAVRLLVDGGPDPFRANAPVGSYIRKYDASLSYPFVFASGNSDGFNRNVILSRYPFADLNGDGRATYDQFANATDLFAPGGGPGIRGWALAEINLPDVTYRGNLVVGNSHLKSGGAAADIADRLEAAQNIAYFIDYWFNGGGTSIPDPRSRISDFPQATAILDSFTPVIWGGDLNEDERDNGRDGPALWMSRAAVAGPSDGTDRDRTDSVFDDARDPLNANASSRNTQSSSKLDYLLWQDSVATLRRSFIYVSSSGGPPAYPPEMIGYPTVALATSTASDHKPVIADFILPPPVSPPGAFTLLSPADASVGLGLTPTLSWSSSSGAASYTVRIDDNPSFSSPFEQAGIAATSFAVPSGILAQCGTYWWTVVATNTSGSTSASNGPDAFSTLIPADFNADGFADFFDYDDFVACYEGFGCPPGKDADFNGDGFADFFDYDDFVLAYEEGC
jgi:endonuclease/exonuclease/phosphatase family metal-dependent hydrolase